MATTPGDFSKIITDSGSYIADLDSTTVLEKINGQKNVMVFSKSSRQNQETQSDIFYFTICFTDDQGNTYTHGKASRLDIPHRNKASIDNSGKITVEDARGNLIFDNLEDFKNRYEQGIDLTFNDKKIIKPKLITAEKATEKPQEKAEAPPTDRDSIASHPVSSIEHTYAVVPPSVVRGLSQAVAHPPLTFDHPIETKSATSQESAIIPEDTNVRDAARARFLEHYADINKLYRDRRGFLKNLLSPSRDSRKGQISGVQDILTQIANKRNSWDNLSSVLGLRIDELKREEKGLWVKEKKLAGDEKKEVLSDLQDLYEQMKADIEKITEGKTPSYEESDRRPRPGGFS